MKILTLIIIFTGCLLAQPSSYPMAAAPPTGVQNLNAQIVGAGTGGNTRYYVVVAIFTIGQGTVAMPTVVNNAPATLSMSNYVRLSWAAVPGALSYTIVRPPTGGALSTCTNCLKATGVTVTNYNDQSNATSGGFTTATVPQATFNSTLNNRDYARSTVVESAPRPTDHKIDGNVGLDASTARDTKNTKLVITLPSTCEVGEEYWLTTAIAGSNIYLCTSANVLTPITTGGPSSGVINPAMATDCAIYSDATAISGYSDCVFVGTAPATPSAPVITHAGMAGMATWGYGCVGRSLVVATAVSATGQTTTGNATLTSSNYNIVDCGTCPASITNYDVYRRASGGTPATLGYIGSTPCGTPLQDKALAGDGNDPTFLTVVGTGMAVPVLHIGLQEPAGGFLCCDGNATSLSVVKNGSSQTNYVSAGSPGSARNYFNYYTSQGTVDAPMDSLTGDYSQGNQYLAYHNGAYRYIAFFDVLPQAPGMGGVIDLATYSDDNATSASFMELRNMDAEVCLGSFSCEIGIHAVSTSRAEVNNGSPVAAGGTLVQLDTATINFTAINQGSAVVGSAGAAICWKTTTTLSYCESVVGAGGTCTCH